MNPHYDYGQLRTAIATAKERLALPWLLAALDLPGHARRSARCPLHEDQTPSFSIFHGAHGWRWKCHAGCGEGDEIDFLEAHFGSTRAEAIRRYLELAGQAVEEGGRVRVRRVERAERTRSAGPVARRERMAHAALQRVGAGATEPGHDALGLDEAGDSGRVVAGVTDPGRDAIGRGAPGLNEAGYNPGPRLPADATPGTAADWRALAALRHLTVFAPARAASLGTLFFGTIWGARCWIITDERRLCAEARRLDGRPFPACGALGERKAHTLRGSVKHWPVGLAVRGLAVADFRAVLAVEGGPDYLAALDLTLAAQSDCLPIALLGAGVGGAIHPEALALLAGKRVRFYPHHEPSGAGHTAAGKWSRQFAAYGCAIDAVDFAGLRCADGRPVKDLNDCSTITPETFADLLQPLLP